MNQALSDRQLGYLKSELRSAKACRDRWIYLGRRLGKANTKAWKSRLALLDAEIKLIELMIEKTTIT
jgi:hypothetical protein